MESNAARVEPLFNFKNITDGSVIKTNYLSQKLNQSPINMSMMPKKIPLLKVKDSSNEQMQLAKEKLSKNRVEKRKLDSLMLPHMSINTGSGTTTEVLLSPNKKPQSRQSLTTKISEKSKISSVAAVVADQKLVELKEMQNLLQRSSYIAKEKPVGRRPTLEVIKDAIEREKNKTNEKNEGTSFSAFYSDVSTNTKSKRKKLIKKKRVKSDGASTIKQKTYSPSPPSSAKLKKKSSESLKSKLNKTANKKKTIRKKLNPKTTVSVGIQYSVQK